jgi:hypothetical protein
VAGQARLQGRHLVRRHLSARRQVK